MGKWWLIESWWKKQSDEGKSYVAMLLLVDVWEWRSELKATPVDLAA
jgi:hypothetical protein